MTRIARIALVATVLMLALVLGACGTAGTSGDGGSTGDGGTNGGTTGGTPPTSAAVEMSGLSFSPSSVEIAVGGTVTWTNKEGVAHTVIGPDWGSGTIPQDGTFSQTFDTAGTFEYVCSIHPSMVGTVVVK